MPLRLERKILDVGGSKSVAIPPGWLAAYNLTSGDKVDVLVDSVVIVKPKGLHLDLELVAKELRPMIEREKGRWATIMTKAVVRIARLKQFAEQELDPVSSLRDVILMEENEIPVWEFLGKVSIWLNLLRKERTRQKVPHQGERERLASTSAETNGLSSNAVP
jgi:antitoxin component of MazEF toxin-antitoxin module